MVTPAKAGVQNALGKWVPAPPEMAIRSSPTARALEAVFKARMFAPVEV